MNSLKRTNVLIVDCQTTGSSPEHGDLLELGWGKYCATKPIKTFREFGITDRLVKLAGEQSIPSRVSELTGITTDELDDAASPRAVWNEFREALGEVEHILAHYAQFENRFLSDLATRYDSDQNFEKMSICSHQLSQRLLNGLPRKGIRAVAGYWGHSMPEEKRSREHVLATAVIWKHLLDELDEQEGIDTLEELIDWMNRTSSDQDDNYRYPIDRNRRLSLPEEPGIYRLLNRNDRILYVGKASSLKSRVNSYFQSGTSLSETKLELVSQVRDVDVETTETPLEAAFMEVNEIKEHQPPYNSDLLNEGREIYYCSASLKSVSKEPTFIEFEGPFDRRQPIHNLNVIRDWIRNPEDPRTPKWGHLRRIYEEDRLRDGVKQFIQNWNRPDGPVKAGYLLRIGRILWRDRNESDTDSDAEPEREPSKPLEPESIRERIESVLMWSSRHVRRGRWFRALFSSKIIWKPFGTNNSSWRILILRNGSPVGRSFREQWSEQTDTQFNSDLSSFDVFRFDRLRVLTTEFKRLLNEEKPLKLVSMNSDETVLQTNDLTDRLSMI